MSGKFSQSAGNPGRQVDVSPALARNQAAIGDALYARGKFQEAFDHFQQCIRLQPNEPAYHYRVANAAWKANQPQRVEAHFREAIRLDPRFAEAHKMLAQWFTSRHQAAPALDHSAAALALAPDDPDTRITRAVVLTRERQTQAAWELIAPLVARGLADRHLASAYAWLAPHIGHESQAAALIERALQNPALTPIAKRLLHVDAATLLERIGRFTDAFVHMRKAKGLVQLAFDPAAYSQTVSGWINYFTREKLQSLPRATHGSRRPVFIIGLPRSGSTLIEQILASHPAIFGGGELSLLPDAVNSLVTAYRARGAAYPQCVDLLSTGDANRFGGEYLAGINSLNSAATYVTDKMPQNYEFLGVIELLLPECRVIHCRRDPRDTCLSCFMTDFDTGNAFSLNLSHLASYCRDYQWLMKHWRSASSLRMLEVRYEDVVGDLPGQTRRMLDFLELPWDDRCIAFHENKRAVATASRDQVRKPIYTSSIGRWKRYERDIPELLTLVEEDIS